MANYQASVLAEAKHILNQRFAAAEKRMKTAGVFGAFLKNTELAIPNIGALRTSPNRAEKAYFQNRTKRANAGARSHDHTGAVGDSTEVALTWKSYTQTAQTSLKRSRNNIYEDAQILANELENMFKNLYEDADADALAFLGTNKTTVNGATRNGNWNPTNNVFEINSSNIARFIQHGKSMLRQNYYTGGAEMIFDPVLYLEAEHYLQQGTGNGSNTAYQSNIGNIYEAVTLNDANYAAGAGYFVPEGSIGVVDWLDPVNVAGRGDFDSVLGGYGVITDPMTGIQYQIHGYSNRADTSAAGGEVQDIVTEWEISKDLSFQASPLSVAGETTIFETGIVTA